MSSQTAQLDRSSRTPLGCRDARGRLPRQGARRRRDCPDSAGGRRRSVIPRCGVRHLRNGHQEDSTRFVNPPQIFGHELAGTIVEVGRGVRKFKPGDRVVSFHHIPCGDCSTANAKFLAVPGLQEGRAETQAGFDPNGGGFAQYVRQCPGSSNAACWLCRRTCASRKPRSSNR